MMNPSDDPGSAIPKIVREWLPDSWMTAKPATIEAVWAVAMSVAKLGTAVWATFQGAAETIGIKDTDVAGLLTFAAHYHWLPVIVTALWTASKGRRAFARAAANQPANTSRP